MTDLEPNLDDESARRAEHEREEVGADDGSPADK
jgi:hypothetical protein